MAGYKTWAALEEVTAANMNSYLRDNSIPQFSSAAARTAAIAAPIIGTFSYLTDTGSLEVYYGATTGWRPPWGQPWGISAGGRVTGTPSSQSYTSATWTDVTGMAVTFTAVANRYYEVSCAIGWSKTSDAMIAARLFDTTSSTWLTSSRIEDGVQALILDTGLYMTAPPLTFTAGSHTIKLQASNPVSAGTGYTFAPIYGGSAFVAVKDVGPSGNAPTA